MRLNNTQNNMAISTLNEYYQSKGQALPSLSERQGIAAQAGIQNYTGSAQQNTQLLGNLMSNGSNNQVSVPSTSIPAGVATGTTQQLNLPNKPQPQEPANVYSNASAYVSALPKTGVAGLDQTIQAMTDRPGQLAREYDIANKQSLMNEAKFKLDSFNEQYRVQQERIRTEGGRSLEQINSEVNAIERTRAFTAGTLAIEAAYRTGDFQGAKELMNQQVALELEPMKMKYQFFKDMYERTEDQKFQRAMKAEDRAYQTARENSKMLNDLKLEGLKNGISWDAMKDVQSIDDYYKIVGQEKGLSENAIDLIKTAELINTAATERTRGFRRGVGRRGLFGLRAAPEVPKAGTQVADFRSDLDRLKGLLAKDSLSTLKGTISDKDIVFLERLGTSLNYTMTEDKFNQALIQLDDTFKRNYGVGFRPTDVKDPAGLGIDTAQLDPAGILQ